MPTPVLLPGEFRGPRRLVGYSLWDGKSRKDMTEQRKLSPFSLPMKIKALANTMVLKMYLTQLLSDLYY